MKQGDLVRYKSNAFMQGPAPKSYGTGIVLRVDEPTVDPDTGDVWTDQVINVMWSSSYTTWDTKTRLEVIN